MKLTMVELFAGVGGFRLGLENASKDWETVWANQWEPSASKKNQFAYNIYQKNFGESDRHSNEDIGEVDKTTIPDHTLLVGGFPCQDYSVARTGAKGIQGKKGVLWWQIADTVEAKRPPFILLENVDRLIKSPTTQRGRDFAIMLYTLNNLGYSVEWRVINAAEFGEVQRRRRVFIFAFHESTKYAQERKKLVEKDQEIFGTEKYSNGLSKQVMQTGFFAKEFPVKQELKIKNRYLFESLSRYKDIVELSDNYRNPKNMFFNSGLMIDGEVFSAEVTADYHGEIQTLGSVLSKEKVDEKYFLTEKKIKQNQAMKGSKKIERRKPNGEIYYYSEGSMSMTDSWDKPARTMLTSEGSMNRSSHIIEDYQTKELRHITPEEAEQIQGFPIGWTKLEGVSDRQRYFTMGNALVVPLITRMGINIQEIIRNENRKDKQF